MDNEKFEFILWDRIEKIRNTFSQNPKLYTNSYIAHSGVKDSVVLTKLIDLAIPNNEIPLVTKITGIENPLMIKFIRKLAKEDNRFIIIPPKENIKKALTKYGYPFKSKQHGNNLFIYRNNIEICDRYRDILSNRKKGLIDRVKNGKSTRGDTKWVINLPKGVITFIKYWYGLRIKKIKYVDCNGKNRKRSILYLSIKHKIPNILKYQFTKEYQEKHTIFWSAFCCKKFKKEVFKEFELNSKLQYSFTGMRRDEGGMRSQLKCIEGNHINFLAPEEINDDFEWYVIKKYNLPMCELYYPPYNFKRTGCSGCPYALDLKNELKMRKRSLIMIFKNICYISTATYMQHTP